MRHRAVSGIPIKYAAEISAIKYNKSVDINAGAAAKMNIPFKMLDTLFSLFVAIASLTNLVVVKESPDVATVAAKTYTDIIN